MNYDDGMIFEDNTGKNIENMRDILESEAKIPEIVKMICNKENYDSFSDTEKIDYKIVRYLITKYAFDRDFTLKVAKRYFESKEFDVEDIEAFEILILMDRYKTGVVDEKNTELEGVLELRLDLLYKTLCNYALNRVKENASKYVDYPVRYFGTGFKYLEDKYEDSKLIKDYISSRRIKEIFENIDIVERYIHNTYETKEEFSNVGVYRFIIDYVYQVDSALSRHISCNQELLKKIIDMIFNILGKWDSYEEYISVNLCGFISECCDSTMPKEITKRQVFRYLGKKLNKKELLDYVSVIEEESDDDITHYVYVSDLADADEAMKKRNLSVEDTVIIIEEDIKLKDLNANTVEWLNKLETVIKGIHTKEIEKNEVEPEEKEKNKSKGGKVIFFRPKKS